MAKRISEQITEYLTLGGDGFTPQTSVPLQVQGHTILGTTQTNNNNDNYKANLTTINGHLIINSSYNNNNNYSQGIRINKGSDNKALLMLGGDTNSTEGTNDMTWYIGTFPTAGSSSTTDLIIARGDYQFNYKKPSLQFNDNGLFVYKNLQMKSTVGNNAGFYLYGGNTTDSNPVSYGSLLITTIGTTSTTGVTRLMLGNSTASSSNNNARGLIRLYGSSSRYSDIYSTADSSSKTLYLPNAAGWLIVGGNGSSTGVGSSSQPIYINTSGVATAITGTIDNNAKTATAANITTTINAIAYYTNTSGTFGTKASANGALYATSANGSLNWGTLPVGQGGTGATSLSSNYVLVGNGSSAIQARENLQVPSSGSITSGTNIIPNTTNIYDLGSSTNKWNNIYGSLKGNADTATGANIATTSQALAYYSNTTGTFENADLIYVGSGKRSLYIDTNNTADKVEYVLHNYYGNLCLRLHSDGTRGLYSDKWLLKINSSQTIMDISNLKVKLKTINPYYSHTSAVNSITSNAYSAIWSANYASIEESGMYLISVSIQFGQGFNYWWGGILPVFIAESLSGYNEKYLVGLEATTGGNRILTGGVGSSLVSLYYTPNNTSHGSLLWIKNDSTTTYSITSSKIEALKVGNIIF